MSAIKEALYDLGEVVTKLEETMAQFEDARLNGTQPDMFPAEQRELVAQRLDQAIEKAETLLNGGQAHG